MQLSTMDCTGRSNINERDSELGDEMSHDDHSGDEMCDCNSIEGGGSRFNSSVGSNGAGTTLDVSGPDNNPMGHHHQLPTNHSLNALGSFMSISSLHGITNLQHNDVLEKLKMQVRDIKVGLMDQECAVAQAAVVRSNALPTSVNAAFTLPSTTMSPFTHAAQTLAPASNNFNSSLSSGGPSVSNGAHNSFSFTSPTAPFSKDINFASNSSTSSETSNSSQQNNGWSFEEQYKQVRQLYEINDDPKRKEFLDELFSFMQKRGTPINRLPIMAKSVLDLYELYNLVIARGGLVDVINKKLWQEIIKGLHLPSSITSAAFTLRTQYMKYLYPYECEKKNLSTPSELQAAIDGNRREGRRSSYGQYEAMHSQMQMPQMPRQSLPGGMQQISPLALVTHAANNQQAQAAAAAAVAHHRLMAPSFGQVPNLVTQEIEQRMIEYLKLIQVKKEQNALSNASVTMGISPHQQQQLGQRSQSPEKNAREVLNALEMSRVALWQMYHNNTSPPVSVNTSPQVRNVSSGGCHELVSESQRSEALNLSESPTNLNAIKREREREPSPEIMEHNEFHHQLPAKRGAFPTSFYLPPAMSNYKGDHHVDNDTEVAEEHDHDEHNTTTNSFHDEPDAHQQLNSSSLRIPVHHDSNNSVHNDKSDDSAIENSPSTSAGNGQISPVSTKKIHLSKTQQHNTPNAIVSTCSDNVTTEVYSSLSPFDALNFLSGMQFRVTRNSINSNGEHQLVVNLDINGIKYSGVLIANTSNLATTTTVATKGETTVSTILAQSVDDCIFNTKDGCKSFKNESDNSNCNQDIGVHSDISANNNNNSNETNQHLVVAMNPIQGTSELTDTKTTPDTSSITSHQTNVVNANGPKGSTNALKDPLIES